MNIEYVGQNISNFVSLVQNNCWFVQVVSRSRYFPCESIFIFIIIISFCAYWVFVVFDRQQVHQRLPDGIIPVLDPVAAMKIKDKDFLEMHQRSRIFEDRLLAHKLHKDKKVEALCKLYHEKQEVYLFWLKLFSDH